MLWEERSCKTQTEQVIELGDAVADEKASDRICGVWAVNIETGEAIAFLRFEDAVQEIFSVQVLPGILFPEVIDWDKDLMASSYVLPDEALAQVARIPPEERRGDGKMLEFRQTSELGTANLAQSFR